MAQVQVTSSSAPSESRIAARRPRSYLAGLAADVSSRPGARIGLAWIGFLAVLAVFAPLIANSHPLVYKLKGDPAWGSPLLTHLTAVDWTLLVAFLSGVVLLFLRRVRGRTRLWAWLGTIAVAAVVTLTLVRPPVAVVYDQYRRAIDTGEVEVAVHTLVPFSPTDRLRDRGDMRVRPPDPPRHWMGTTLNGEDLLSRMIHATRIALAIGLIATGIAVVIGVAVGGVMGYFAGWVDLLGMRLLDIVSAIPRLFLLIMFTAFYGRNLYLMMVIIGLTGWVGDAVFIRAEFLKLRRQDFVHAAIACGLPLRSLLFRHMLPNGVTPVLISASFGVASAILAESTLSFLGLGLVEEPSWGQMLNQARSAGGTFYWWIATFPGAAIFCTLFAYVLLGEALRDAIDPHLARTAQI